MNIAIILAGGIGTRLGSNIPKQYIEVKGKSILGYCLDKFLLSKCIDAIQIVANEEWHEYINKYINQNDISSKFSGYSMPGENRQLSIYNALNDVKTFASDFDYVMIHDAVRPLVSERLIECCFKEVKKCDGVIPVIPVKDTVYISENGSVISELVDRKKVFAGQTPEVFILGKYYRANTDILRDKILSINGSTEPAVLAGMNISMVAGDEENFKITTESDLEQFRQKLNKGKGI